MEVVTEAQMRALEAEAMASGRVTGRALMERAGDEVVKAVFRHWPDAEAAAGTALILCGPGNNGGDGYVIARLLWQRGWNVGVFASHLPAETGDAGSAARDWLAFGGEIAPMDQLPQAMALADAERPLLVVDGLLGIGQSRSTDDILAAWWQAHDSAVTRGTGQDLRCVSVDMPTGYDCDTGRRLGERPFPADLVVTFHAAKPVHATLDAQGVTTCVVPIGL
ncbi:MAG: NAD(P)H-hydrate epimerase [Rhodobacterales bacterium]